MLVPYEIALELLRTKHIHPTAPFHHRHLYIHVHVPHIHVLMRDEKEERKKQARQTNNKAKQHSTPKAVTCPKKNELPRVGLEPTTLYTLDRALYHVHVIRQ